MTRRDPEEYLRDIRSNKEVHEDYLNALRFARCTSVVVAQAKPYVDLGDATMIKTRSVEFRCTLPYAHDGDHLTEVGTLTEPRQLVFPRDGSEAVLSPEIRKELGR